LNRAELWAFYLKYIDNPKYEKTFLELIESEEAFKVATQALISISTNEQERYNLFARQKVENDYNHDMAMSEEIGRQQGREEGIQQGVLQGIFQTAKRMLKRGKTVSEVVENTGLTEQQIISLKEEN
ncbi:MAG: hypothetical protein LBM93_10470, partial [Oscillospiraceae bacterium]|jgi:predicted transposase/invertase (TIGR01784 family)|nr:hypothetical protein [Oscillospiraceae bacterium]